MLSFSHLTSTTQITRDDTDFLLKKAAEMEKIVDEKGGTDLLNGRVLANLFYEPSTRTRLSFDAAMNRLGGSVISAIGIENSSLKKGETLEDTIMMVSQYADCIAMRHPEAGSADRAAAVSRVPFINGGDGANQHPTQGLLDLYTISKERGKLEGLTVAMVGDLKFGRTVHSLSILLSLYDDINFIFVAPDELKMPDKVTNVLQEKSIAYTETTQMKDALDADVLYMTRVQGERFDNPADYERLKDSYILNAELLKGKDCSVLHPLPRVNEIATDVDTLPNASYFREAHNGMIMRMAIIAAMLKAL